MILLGSMNKILVAVVVILVVAAAGLYLISKSSSNVTGNAIIDDGSGANSDGELKTFVVTGDHLRFFIDGKENPDIRVKEGDWVRIDFSSTEGFHDWVVDEFGAATAKVPAGESTFVEFIAGQKGTFEYYCSVGQHRANGMKGRFIVE